MPSRTTLSDTALDDIYDVVKEQFLLELKSNDISSICVMYDGWSDRKGLPYVGIRIPYIRKDWEHRVITLSCKLLHGHTSDNLGTYIKEEIKTFNLDIKKQKIFMTHNGAANMMKASRILQSCHITHCLAHSLHLLLVKDGIEKVAELNSIIEKCGEINKKLHFKGCELQNEKQNLKNIEVFENIMAKVSEVNEILELNECNPVKENDEIEELGFSVHHYHNSLKKNVVTRWNSILHMICSILDNFDAINKVLVRIGERELKLDNEDKDILNDLSKFLTPFETYTRMVSASGIFLSLIPLIKAKIEESTSVPTMTVVTSSKCKPCHIAVIALKRNIAANIDKRLKISHAVKMATLLDPSTKTIAMTMFSESETERLNMMTLTAGIADQDITTVTYISSLIKRELLQICIPSDDASSSDLSWNDQVTNKNSACTTALVHSPQNRNNIDENVASQLSELKHIKIAII